MYIFHTPSEAVFHRRDAFRSLLKEQGKVSTTEEVFHQRDGKAVFTLGRVVDAQH